MPQSLSSVLVHLVFRTKNREPWIRRAVEGQLHAYIGGILRDIQCPSLTVGGTADHVHILFVLSRTMAISSVVEEVKTGSSKWIKTVGPAFRNFHWQAGRNNGSKQDIHPPRRRGVESVWSKARYQARRRATRVAQPVKSRWAPALPPAADR